MEMNLEQILTYIDEKELKIVFNLEQSDPEFLNAADYLTSYARAKAGRDIASIQGTKVLALLDATHRMREHGENREAEIEQLTQEIKKEYLAMITDENGQVREFWNG